MKHHLPIPAKPGSTMQQLRDALAENNALVDEVVRARKTIMALEQAVTPQDGYRTLLVINYKHAPEGIHFDIIQKDIDEEDCHMLLSMATGALMEVVSAVLPPEEPEEMH